jgi:hypothetical protein
MDGSKRLATSALSNFVSPTLDIVTSFKSIFLSMAKQ